MRTLFCPKIENFKLFHVEKPIFEISASEAKKKKIDREKVKRLPSERDER